MDENPYEIFWADLGSSPNFSGIELCANENMALDWAKVRLLYSSLDSFAFINDRRIHGIDGRMYRLHWDNREIVCLERASPDWNKPRVRPN